MHFYHFKYGLQVTGFPVCYHKAVVPTWGTIFISPGNTVWSWHIIHPVNNSWFTQCDIILSTSIRSLNTEIFSGNTRPNRATDRATVNTPPQSYILLWYDYCSILSSLLKMLPSRKCLFTCFSLVMVILKRHFPTSKMFWPIFVFLQNQCNQWNTSSAALQDLNMKGWCFIISHVGTSLVKVSKDKKSACMTKGHI